MLKVIIPSKTDHNAQVITGFLMLQEKGYPIELVDDSNNTANPFYNLPVLQVIWQGKKILYDHWDGYQHPELMKKCLDWADIYFKRSFSEEQNTALFPEDAHKIYPLGLHFHVTHKHFPFQESFLKGLIKSFCGKTKKTYFEPNVFEGRPGPVSGKIIFFTRLWDPDTPGLDNASREERRQLNKTRIAILRTLKNRYGSRFVGGLDVSPLSRVMAPDLIMPAKYTKRKNYLKLLHSCDICIGSTGLHQSIGWKTAEYVAAAKAIVNETLHYRVPGDFLPGKNYLPYQTVEQCLDAVGKLMDNPQLLLDMQIANQQYYHTYLRPDVLVENSLKTVQSTPLCP